MYQMSLYSIYDKAAGTFNSPVCCVSDAVAIRMLRETLADRSTILARYPDDYQLVKIGDFLVENGQINPCLVVLVDGFRDLLSQKEGGSCGGSVPPQAAERSGSTDRDHEAVDSDSSSLAESAAQVKSKKDRR